MEFTRQHVEHIVGRHHALARKFEALKGKFEGITAGTVETLEVSAGALLGGVIDGRWGSKEKGLPTLMHIPITLGGGILLNVLGHFDVAGKEWSPHLCNIGNGVLASYLSSVGFHFGQNWQQTGRFLGAKKTAGQFGTSTVAGDVDKAAELMDRIAPAQRVQQAQPAG